MRLKMFVFDSNNKMIYSLNYVKLKLGDTITSIHTIGFNVETLELPSGDWTIWDVGGCDKIRPLWRHYFPNTAVVFWFVDSGDRERFETSNHELSLLAAEQELSGVPFVIVANKQDKPNVMTPGEIAEQLNVAHIFRHEPKRYSIVSTCGVSGEGLFEMFEEADRLIKGICPGTDCSSDKTSQNNKPNDDDEAILVSFV
jgi:GTPase SAR1 family protein